MDTTMENSTRKKLKLVLRPEMKTYMEKAGPNLEILMRVTKKRKYISGYKRYWCPPYPRPAPIAEFHDNIMVEIEAAVTQYLHNKGYVITSIDGDACKAVWIYWAEFPPANNIKDITD